MLVDAALPFISYQILTGHGIDIIHALIISGVFPAAWSVFGIARVRRVDIIGGIVLLGIAVSIVAALIGGTPKLLLIRESFVTGALGIVALASLLAPRPLMFYFARQIVTGMNQRGWRDSMPHGGFLGSDGCIARSLLSGASAGWANLRGAWCSSLY